MNNIKTARRVLMKTLLLNKKKIDHSIKMRGIPFPASVAFAAVSSMELSAISVMPSSVFKTGEMAVDQRRYKRWKRKNMRGAKIITGAV